jgi:hypothetical protein
MAQLADVGHGVWIGNSRACELGATRRVVIHLHSRLPCAAVDSVFWYPADSGETALSEESRYLETARNLAPFGLRSVVLRMTSAEAARLFQPASLDCVYIDANHEYAFVRSDIEIWAPKVRSGGILAGHDYSEQTPDVRRAADEFAAASGRTLYLTRLDEECEGKPVRSWMFVM